MVHIWLIANLSANNQLISLIANGSLESMKLWKAIMIFFGQAIWDDLSPSVQRPPKAAHPGREALEPEIWESDFGGCAWRLWLSINCLFGSQVCTRVWLKPLWYHFDPQISDHVGKPSILIHLGG